MVLPVYALDSTQDEQLASMELQLAEKEETIQELMNANEHYH